MITFEKYKMSFTASGLLRKETIWVASQYLNSGDWQRVRQDVFVENGLQLKTLSSRQRIFREIRYRISCLSQAELHLLLSNQSQDADAMLWLALCRAYQFVGDFAREVLHEKFLSVYRKIEIVDYNLFIEQKSILHPEITLLTDSTNKKIRQVLFHFMRNCGLLDHNNMILPILFSSDVFDTIRKGDSSEFNYFPIIVRGQNK